jgi:hypothetical protein
VFQRRISLFPALLLLPLLLAACQSSSMAPGDVISRAEATILMDPGTNSFALLALRDDSTQGGVPEQALRAAVSGVWQARGFEILEATRVDAAAAAVGQAREVVMPGAAVVEIQILSWNDRLLYSRGQIEVDVALTVYDPSGDVSLRNRMTYATRIEARNVRDLEPEVVESMIVERVAKYLGNALPAKWL